MPSLTLAGTGRAAPGPTGPSGTPGAPGATGANGLNSLILVDSVGVRNAIYPAGDVSILVGLDLNLDRQSAIGEVQSTSYICGATVPQPPPPIARTWRTAELIEINNVGNAGGPRSPQMQAAMRWRYGSKVTVRVLISGPIGTPLPPTHGGQQR